MTPECIYLLKVNMGIALFYAFYKLFCCRDTFFQWRRTALLSFWVLSFLYPLMNMQHWVQEQPTMHELASYYATLLSPEIPSTPIAIAPQSADTLPLPSALQLLGLLYLGGVCLLTLRFFVQLLSIFRLVLCCRTVTVDGVSVRSLPFPANPFSFGPWIFIYLPELEETERKEILTHEQTHVHQWHSADVLLSEIATIGCWMNPFAWLLKQEIRLNLEYLADRKVTETTTDTRHYQYHLLGLANQKRQTGLYNNFNFSHLKNRIMMMNRQRTRTTRRIKYALFAPLAAALLLVSNIETVARTAHQLIHPVAAEEVTTPTPAMSASVATGEAMQGIVTFRLTATNSEGKPQPGITLQTTHQEKKHSVTTDANGKASIEMELDGVRSVAFYATSPKSKEKQIVTVSANQPERTFIFDTDDDIAAYIKAGKRILVKLEFANTDNQPLSDVAVTSSASQQTVQTSAASQGTVQLTVGVGETLRISKKGYKDVNYSVREIHPIQDMQRAQLVRLLRENEDPVYTVVEQMPEYPGGLAACLTFIAQQIKYPAEAEKAQKAGKVIVQFVVEKDGTPNHASVVRSISPELDAEAIRVIKAMPKWQPAIDKGEKVRCRYTVPVNFKLP